MSKSLDACTESSDRKAILNINERIPWVSSEKEKLSRCSPCPIKRKTLRAFL